MTPQPNVASNCLTANGRFGAVAAVSETQDDFRFVPSEAVSKLDFAMSKSNCNMHD